ncbi:uncharacterized protein DUF2868 [Prosthecobacter fusiformis]|uniref:Uncharacterized protein DUF2868 n=1 Tax=Prosthecobacter fusiformis TaxID=48464 RepID=A0A4V3FEF3_9BACT|nr:DUF2868 domain-containing protein [Prosthecobacter fusiformis]TDU64570.1 uncharacterized protein DUF2868 [Prosthecobacter fusiformis]
MDWNDWLSILRWRALEEGDADGAILSEDRRREATARTRGGLTADEVKGDPVTEREAVFLRKRSQWLEREVIGWSGSLVRIMDRLVTLQGRWSWAFIGWAVALVVGYALSGLGQAAEFNLLALPLVGVLLWNAIIMVLSLVWELWPAPQASRGSSLMEWLAQRVSPVGNERTAEGETLTGLTVDQRFALLANAPAMERLQRRLRSWMHIAAALLALGSIIGLYARGWSQEYRAVWESTLLSESGAQKFFGTLFGPTADTLNLALPLEDLPQMHRTGGTTLSPAPALPWIHLYAGTLFLFVMVPRIGLAGLTLWRAHRVMSKRLRKLGWRTYLKRTLRAVEGGQEVIPILIHATDATPTHRDVWARGVRERFGAMIEPEMIHIPLGDEDDFVAGWKPANARVVVIFNLATTPEQEVQRQFVLGVKQALETHHRDADLIVLLDATSIGNRWSPDKVASREKLWTDMLQGVASEVIIAAQRGH